jgi:hypothetical protein
MTNKPSNDWSSTLKMISTFSDMSLAMAAQQPELIDAMEMSIALTKVVFAVVFLFWAVLILQTFRWSRSQTLPGGMVYSWFVYLNGLVAVIGFTFVFALHIGWALLNLDRYEKGGLLEQGLTWYAEQSKATSSSTLDTIMKLVTGESSGKNKKWNLLNPLTYVENAVRALRVRQDFIQTIRYITTATLWFSLASLSIFFLANPSFSGQFASLLVIGAVGVAVVMSMTSSGGSIGSQWFRFPVDPTRPESTRTDATNVGKNES